MNTNTIDETYEYRIKKIIKSAHESQDWNVLASGEELEALLYRSRDLVNALLDDIGAWMGFDDLLIQLQQEPK